MSRDMQIGMLLAVGFLALVGGVLYYRIEHPDELEQYLNGGQQAQATSTAPAADSKTLADASTANPGNKPLPPAPSTASTAPSLGMDTGSTNAPGSNSSPNLTLTGANGTPPPGVSPPPGNSAPAMPVLDFAALDKKAAETKPVNVKAADNKPPESTGASSTRSSLPVDTPGNKLPGAVALAAAPIIALDLANKNDKPPVPEGSKPPEMKVEEKKPVDLTVKTDIPPPGTSSAPDLKLPAAPSGAPSLAMSDTAKPKESEPSKSQELPKPPEVPALGATNTSDAKSAGAPALSFSAPSVASSAAPTMPSVNKDVPETVIKPNVTPEKMALDNDALRTQAPRATLGKPMTESEASLKEKRWADSAGAPAPIIPLSADGRGSTVSAPANTLGERRVVRDTYIPTERALKGETFSSLSQRLYGDTNYAVALAAYNKEEGFVKMDQPEPNEWVAKPNREILDQRYPQLIRRLTPSTFNQRNAATMAQAQPAEKTAKEANLPTYRVGKGEQLFEVAKKTLGDGYRWSEIYSLNKDQFRESTELRPDMILKLPADAKK